MKIIEQFIHGKIADNSYNEDRLVIGDHCAGVIDGSRGPGYMEKDAITAALNDAVDYISNLSIDAAARHTFTALTDLLAKTKRRHGLDELRYTGGFHVVIYHAAQRQIWRVGDCQFRMGAKTYTNDLEVEEIGARQRAVMIHAMRMRGMSDAQIMASDAYAEIFMPFFAPLLDFANRTDHPLGYGVVNGLPIPDAYIQVFDVPATINEIIMTSDGYPDVFDTLRQTEDYLSDLMKRDPMCITEFYCSKGLAPDQVSFDDRTYLRVGI